METSPGGDPWHERLVAEAIAAYHVYWAAQRQSAEPIWSQLELTLSQLKGILLLDARGAMTISQAASILAISRPSASILIDQLVHLGLVDRTTDRADRRRAIVVLTPQGTELVQRLTRGDEEYMRTWFQRMSDSDLVALGRGLRALAGVITPATLEEGAAEAADTLDCAG